MLLMSLEEHVRVLWLSFSPCCCAVFLQDLMVLAVVPGFCWNFALSSSSFELVSKVYDMKMRVGSSSPCG